MKSLNAFLNPGKPGNTSFPLSNRFKDGEKPIDWELRSVSPKEAQLISKRCRTVDKKGNESFDMTRYQNEIIVAAVVFPDLKDSRLQESYEVTGEVELITTMLNMGEYADLRAKVFEVSGIDDDINTKVEEAKN